MPRERVFHAPLPGSDALKSALYFDAPESFDPNCLSEYDQPGGYYRYLLNEDYREYMTLSKSMTNAVSPDILVEYGQKLESETYPEYLRAAGSAYVEASLLAADASAVDRLAIAMRGEQIWQRQLVSELYAGRNLTFEVGDRNEYGGHRTALNLATMPLVKSIIVGNVSNGVMASVLADIAHITDSINIEYQAAIEQDDWTMQAQHKGLLFEAIALMAALVIDDPRYVPLLSTVRGGSGLYNARQTHDIMIVNQHWGNIRKVIPIEIKSRLTKRAKRRYNALVVPGGVRLTINEDDPSGTVNAFSRFVQGEASMEEELAIENIATQFRETLRLYQQGLIRFDDVASNGLIRFHRNDEVVKHFPEFGTPITRV